MRTHVSMINSALNITSSTVPSGRKIVLLEFGRKECQAVRLVSAFEHIEEYIWTFDVAPGNKA